MDDRDKQSHDFAYRAITPAPRDVCTTSPSRLMRARVPAPPTSSENGVYIETGPHKHAIQQTFFLYVYEPGGNRVEVSCAGAASLAP